MVRALQAPLLEAEHYVRDLSRAMLRRELERHGLFLSGTAVHFDQMPVLTVRTYNIDSQEVKEDRYVTTQLRAAELAGHRSENRLLRRMLRAMLAKHPNRALLESTAAVRLCEIPRWRSHADNSSQCRDLDRSLLRK